jgi:hypothetical protein
LAALTTRQDVMSFSEITVPAVVMVAGPVYGVRVTPAGTPVVDASGQPAGATVGVTVGLGGIVVVTGGTVVVGAWVGGVVVTTGAGVSNAWIRPSRLAAFDSSAMILD